MSTWKEHHYLITEMVAVFVNEDTSIILIHIKKKRSSSSKPSKVMNNDGVINELWSG